MGDYPAGSSFRPLGGSFFSVFGNMRPYGEWTLKVKDKNNNEFSGSVVDFTCEITTSTLPIRGCGNGVLDEEEICDDGSNDERGCSWDCSGVREGFTCWGGSIYDATTCIEETDIDPETLKSYRIDQLCDDGNKNDFDGCDHMHKRENGAVCIKRHNDYDLCYANTCGNGILDNDTEECDDGN